MKRRFLFLDKDGTLIVNIPYNVDPEQIELCEGADTALEKLHKHGFEFVIISNQAGIALGYFNESALKIVESRIKYLLWEQFKIPLSGFYYCPHHPLGKVPQYSRVCSCRKPAPGLIFQAAKNLGIDLRDAWFIGDILNDMEAGHLAGCKSILVDTGNETEWKLIGNRIPDYSVSTLSEAAEIIISLDG